MERGGPVWSGVYGTGSSLQHAAQLQLLSQQQMLRQQELLMIQQHTAQVLELQRNAQLVVSGAPSARTYQQLGGPKATSLRLQSVSDMHEFLAVRVNREMGNWNCHSALQRDAD